MQHEFEELSDDEISEMRGFAERLDQDGVIFMLRELAVSIQRARFSAYKFEILGDERMQQQRLREMRVDIDCRRIILEEYHRRRFEAAGEITQTLGQLNQLIEQARSTTDEQ